MGSTTGDTLSPLFSFFKTIMSFFWNRIWGCLAHMEPFAQQPNATWSPFYQESSTDCSDTLTPPTVSLPFSPEDSISASYFIFLCYFCLRASSGRAQATMWVAWKSKPGQLCTSQIPPCCTIITPAPLRVLLAPQGQWTESRNGRWGQHARGRTHMVSLALVSKPGGKGTWSALVSNTAFHLHPLGLGSSPKPETSSSWMSLSRALLCESQPQTAGFQLVTGHDSRIRKLHYSSAAMHRSEDTTKLF